MQHIPKGLFKTEAKSIYIGAIHMVRGGRTVCGRNLSYYTGEFVDSGLDGVTCGVCRRWAEWKTR